MKFLKAGLVIVGAIIGTVCGWMMSNRESYYPVAIGAFVGGMVGNFVADMIEDK